MKTLVATCLASILVIVQSNPRLLRSSQFPTGLTHFRNNTGSCLSCDDNENLSEYLWRQTTDLHQAALDTDFIQGIKAGTLNPTDFGRYMLQDAVWCEKASKSISRAADHVAYTHGLHVRAFLLKEAIDYQGYADDLYQRWQITNPSGIQLNGGCRAYEEYEHMVADTMDVGYFITCMIPCVKLWPWLGSQLISEPNDTFGAYTDWVSNSLDPSYDGYKILDNFIDQMDANGELDEATVLDVFRNCMQGEVDFFKFAT